MRHGQENEQQQEHWDHVAGSASELQNCLSEARMDLSRINAKESMKISEQLSLGKFVVVEEGTYYCRATDGVAGAVKGFHSAHARREDAEAAAESVMERTQGDTSAYVLPLLPVNAPAPLPVADDDIPF